MIHYKYEEDIKVQKQKIFEEKSHSIENMTEILNEKIYQNPDCIIDEIIKKNDRNYRRGKIVGFIDDDYYKVRLENGENGENAKIECGTMNSLNKVIDYKKGIFSPFTSGEDENLEKLFLKHINQNYTFEIIGKTGTEYTLSIENVRIDYLNYAIEQQCILKGWIIQIKNGHVSIESPFGYVFFTGISYVFDFKSDSTFDYMYYLGAEISIIIRYDKNTNKIYPEIANRKYQIIESGLNYIFPVLSIKGERYSKLWLDKRLCINNDKYHPYKWVGQLVRVTGIREKGPFKIQYKGKVKKVYSKRDAPKYKNHLLSVGWITNLCGNDIKVAISYLERKKFPYIIRYSFGSDEDKGVVLAMQPPVKGNRIIPRNVIIELTVNRGIRREYIIPDFTGMHINEVATSLAKNKIIIKRVISNSKVGGIENNCVINTEPSAGNKILSGDRLRVSIYQDTNYESPFVLRENEYSKLENKAKIVASEAVIDYFCSVPWEQEILIFILKHKIVTSSHMKLWIDMNFTMENLDNIDGALGYLQIISMIGSMYLANDSSKTCLHFYFPNKKLYSAFKRFAGYNGFFPFYGKNALYCKIRSAENQAFLSLYRILKEDNIITYEVDCMQDFMHENEQQLLRVHIAVHASNKLKKHASIYFIEAFRFLDEEQLLEGWDKLLRYNMYISRKYTIEPCLLLVFEDEMHYKKFMLKRPDRFRLQYIKLFYTWDSLTNKNYDKFDDIFKEENALC